MNTLRLLEIDALVVRTDDHRLTGEALRAAIEADGDPVGVAAVVATAGTTNAGHHRRPRRRRRRSRASTAGGSTSTAPTAARACSRRRPRHLYDGIEHADSFIVDPHKWLFAPFDCCALLYRTRRSPGPCTSRTPPTSTSSTTRAAASGTRPTTPTTSPGGPGACRCGSRLSVYGVGAYTEAIETAIRLARRDRRRDPPPRRTWS